MSKYRIIYLVVSFVGSSVFGMNLSHLKFKEVKVPPKSFFISEQEPQQIPVVTLIDHNGAIPTKTMSLMSINHSNQLAEHYPHAHNNCKIGHKNPIVKATRIIIGAPDEWRKTFLPYLDLNDKKSQEKFESLPLGQSLVFLAIAQKLHDTPWLKGYSVDQLFSLTGNQLKVSEQLCDAFSKGHTQVQVDRLTYDITAGLPESLREKFCNNKEFLRIQLMPSYADRLRHVMVHTAIGAILGSGTMAIGGLATASGEKFVGPAVQEFAQKTFTNVTSFVVFDIVSGNAHYSGVKNAFQTIANIMNNEKNNTKDLVVDVITQTPQAYVKGFTHNAEYSIKNACKIEKFLPILKNQITQGGKPLSSVGINKAWNKAIKFVRSLGLPYGVFIGFIYGVATMNEPIGTENISKL